MKLLKHQAIYIFLAVNAFGGWHDSGSFIAWPATNHLRWADNVGVYTNASNPTNPAYGGWTNNFLPSLIYDYDDGTWTLNTPFYLPLEGGLYGDTNTWLMNAKDVRSIDCVNALFERHLVLGGHETNFWEEMLGYSEADVHNWFYRNEAQNIATLKRYISRKLGDFYGTTNNWATATNYTAVSLCVASSVPTNFLDYTPARAADGSWTHYQRILTNTFILRQGTNATHVATNSLIDSAAVQFFAVGTNGTVITRYATNTSQQAGSNLGAYGFDGLRRVITNLKATAYSGGWTNNGTSNSWVGYSRQFPPSYPIQQIFFAGEMEGANTNAHAFAYTNLMNLVSNAISTYPTERTVTHWGITTIGGNNYEYVDAIHTITRSYPWASIPSNGFGADVRFYGKTRAAAWPYEYRYNAFNFGVSNETWFAAGSGTNTSAVVIGSTNTPPFFTSELPDIPPLDVSDADHVAGWESGEVKALAIWDFTYK